MAAFLLKKKKEVTETVEEPQKTVEAAKKEAETVNTEPPATIVCPACGREINKKTAEKNKYVCYECGNYFRVRTKNRIRMVADKDTFKPHRKRQDCMRQSQSENAGSMDLRR